MKKNFMLIVTTVFALLFAVPMTTEAAENGKWVKSENGWMYEVEEGSYYVDGFCMIDDVTYYFDSNGIMATEWQLIDECWYYFGTDGAMATDWKLIAGVWYYFDEYSGYMYSDGIWEIDGEMYIIEKSGACVVTAGWLKRYEDWYYINAGGAIATDWTVIAGGWYYFDKYSGYMYSDGWKEIEGKNWLFDENGAWKHANGWNWAMDGWFYLEDWNTPATGFKEIDGAYYWFEQDAEFYNYGQMFQGGSKHIDGATYLFANNGARIKGWYNYSDAYSTYPYWVYCNEDGTGYTGWVASGGDWYYIVEGYMETGWFTDDATGKQYYIGRDGKLVYGWYYEEYKDDTGCFDYTWHYTDPATGEVYDGWLNDGGKWYYIEGGVMCYADVIHDYKKHPQSDDYDYDKDGSLNYEEYSAYQAAYEAWEKTAYILGTDGVLVSGGWYTFSSTYGTSWYYANANGTAYDGWLNYGGAWYYIDLGYMVTNQYVDGYWVGADGIRR